MKSLLKLGNVSKQVGHIMIASGIFAAVLAFSKMNYGMAESNYIPIVEKDSTEREKSLNLFTEVAKVLRHPRCANCHPNDNNPRQSDNMHKHLFNVQRGADDRGAIGMRCYSCHGASNNVPSGVPGVPEPNAPNTSRWHLAPLSMGWMGLNDAELGERLLNREMNGNMSPEDLVKHMEEDPLVLWGWNPGPGREPIPISHGEFMHVLKEWVATGAHVPRTGD